MPSNWPLLWNEFAANYYALSFEFRKKEIGYQLTILANLAHIKQCFPCHNIWGHSRIRSALNFIHSSDCEQQIRKQESNYGSMTPAINNALVLEAFENSSNEELRPWIELEINRKYDPETKLLTRKASDPMLQSTAIGSLSYLPDIQIKLTNR